MISLFPPLRVVPAHLPVHCPPMIRRRALFDMERMLVDLERELDGVRARVWLEVNDPGEVGP